MNEVWNLDVIYRGFDDPAFAADMEKLEKLVQDYVAFAGELDRQTPLDGLKKGVALEESLSELSGKLVEYAFLRQSGNTRDAEAGSRLGQVMQILTGAAGAQAQWREWVSKIPDLMVLVAGDETLKDYTFLFESLLRNSTQPWRADQRQAVHVRLQRVERPAGISDQHRAGELQRRDDQSVRHPQSGL